MAWSREINAEHFVGVSAGSQIGAMGPGITAVGATADFTPRQLIIVFGPGRAGAPEGELSLDDGNDRVVSARRLLL